jgi:two-component system chemotaxis sensor kinase CheA
MLSAQPSTPPSPPQLVPVVSLAEPVADETPAAVVAASELEGLNEKLPRVSVGIRIKLIALMVSTSFLIVSVLTSYFTARQVASLRTELRERAAAYGRLASLQLRSSVAFKDRETAREVLGAIAKDSLIKGVALYRDDGTHLDTEGTISELGLSARLGFGEARTFALPGRILLTIPVHSLEGPRGNLLMELSTAPVNAARAQEIRTALSIGLGALLLGILLAWGIARSIARRVENIALAASEVAKGDLERTLVLDGPRDEIGILAHAFDAMVRQLRELIGHIQRSAREENVRLEHLVGERTVELDRKNSDLQLVLDNVEQGFVTIDRAAKVVGEKSRIVANWLGQVSVGDLLWAALDRASPGCGARFEAGWSQLVDGFMPASVCLAQMPHELTIDGRHLRFEYKRLEPQEEFEKVLVVISDATAEAERDRTEQQERDLLSLSSRLLHDRVGFLEFAAETNELLDRITRNTSDLGLRKRDLHTLKGNSALFGLATLSRLCHDLESDLESGAERLDCSSIVEQWQSVHEKTYQLLGEHPVTDLAVGEGDYEALLAAVRARRDYSSLERLLGAWRLEPLRVRLERAAEQLTAVAERAGKGTPIIAVEAASVYLAREELSEFWTVFSHVVRNGVSHGLADLDQRALRSGTPKNDFELRAGVQDGLLFVELQDSGPGIDWDAIRSRAESLGLPASTEQDLLGALFAEGVSTEGSVSELSGRGVGLGAVRDTCTRQHGKIDVATVKGAGTKFRFSWPAAQFKSLIELDTRRPA